jgi:hypothetical protein
MLERACARLPDGPERAKIAEFAGFFVLDEQAVKDEEPVSRKRESRTFKVRGTGSNEGSLERAGFAAHGRCRVREAREERVDRSPKIRASR